MRIRSGRLADAPAVARLMRASIRGLARASYTDAQLAAWSSLPALYHRWAMTAGGERYVVAEERGRLVGYAATRGRELTALFVVPARARTGIGAALLAAIERRLARAGERTLFTRAALSGVRFYRARGFADPRSVRVPLPGGGSLRAVLLRKRLAA
jgi:GNAT superfamily N-acetyltransferase